MIAGIAKRGAIALLHTLSAYLWAVILAQMIGPLDGAGAVAVVLLSVWLGLMMADIAALVALLLSTLFYWVFGGFGMAAWRLGARGRA